MNYRDRRNIEEGAQLLRQCEGIDIYVESDGKFAAKPKPGGEVIRRTTVAALEKVLTASDKPLLALELSESYGMGGFHVRKVKITGFTRTRFTTAPGENDLSKYSTLAPWAPLLYQRLLLIRMEVESRQDRLKAVRERLLYEVRLATIRVDQASSANLARLKAAQGPDEAPAEEQARVRQECLAEFVTWARDFWDEAALQEELARQCHQARMEAADAHAD